MLRGGILNLPSSFVYGRRLRLTEYKLPTEVPTPELTVQESEDPTAAGPLFWEVLSTTDSHLPCEK